MAKCYLASGEKEQAKEELMRVLTFDQYNVKANIILAQLLKEEGDTAAAVDCLSTVVQTDPLSGAIKKIREEIESVSQSAEIAATDKGAPDEAEAATEVPAGDISGDEEALGELETVVQKTNIDEIIDDETVFKEAAALADGLLNKEELEKIAVSPEEMLAEPAAEAEVVETESPEAEEEAAEKSAEAEAAEFEPEAAPESEEAAVEAAGDAEAPEAEQIETAAAFEPEEPAGEPAEEEVSVEPEFLAEPDTAEMTAPGAEDTGEVEAESQEVPEPAGGEKEPVEAGVEEAVEVEPAEPEECKTEVEPAAVDQESASEEKLEQAVETEEELEITIEPEDVEAAETAVAAEESLEIEPASDSDEQEAAEVEPSDAESVVPEDMLPEAYPEEEMSFEEYMNSDEELEISFEDEEAAAAPVIENLDIENDFVVDKSLVKKPAAGSDEFDASSDMEAAEEEKGITEDQFDTDTSDTAVDKMVSEEELEFPIADADMNEPGKPESESDDALDAIALGAKDEEIMSMLEEEGEKLLEEEIQDVEGIEPLPEKSKMQAKEDTTGEIAAEPEGKPEDYTEFLESDFREDEDEIYSAVPDDSLEFDTEGLEKTLEEDVDFEPAEGELEGEPGSEEIDEDLDIIIEKADNDEVDAGVEIATMTLGEIYLSQGKYEKALNVFEKLKEKEPDNPKIDKKIQEIKKKKKA